MNGAHALLRTLVANGVDTCFTNPGTSEMHFVAALDDVPEMRPVLALFEGVATGAADGYGRMAGRPAATLLHLGPGLGNGLANIHNARRARTPAARVRLTSREVVAGTRNGSGSGGSPFSSDETPVCSRIGATTTPAETRSATSWPLNDRAALGISALPGSCANTV